MSFLGFSLFCLFFAHRCVFLRVFSFYLFSRASLFSVTSVFHSFYFLILLYIFCHVPLSSSFFKSSSSVCLLFLLSALINSSYRSLSVVLLSFLLRWNFFYSIFYYPFFSIPFLLFFPFPELTFLLFIPTLFFNFPSYLRFNFLSFCHCVLCSFLLYLSFFFTPSPPPPTPLFPFPLLHLYPALLSLCLSLVSSQANLIIFFNIFFYVFCTPLPPVIIILHSSNV